MAVSEKVMGRSVGVVDSIIDLDSTWDVAIAMERR